MFLASTIVYTHDGIKLVQDIKIGDLVLNELGHYEKVKNIQEKDINQTDLFTIDIFGHNSITCTSDALLYTQNIYQQVKDFDIESFLYNVRVDYDNIDTEAFTDRELVYILPVMCSEKVIETYTNCYIKQEIKFLKDLYNLDKNILKHILKNTDKQLSNPEILTIILSIINRHNIIFIDSKGKKISQEQINNGFQQSATKIYSRVLARKPFNKNAQKEDKSHCYHLELTSGLGYCIEGVITK